MKHHISYFYNALLEQHVLHQAWCVRLWLKHKLASGLAIAGHQRLLQAAPHSKSGSRGCWSRLWSTAIIIL